MQSVRAVFAMGSNGSGQLGIGHKEDVSVPKAVIFPADDVIPTPFRIATGGNHTLILGMITGRNRLKGTLHCAGDYATGACGLTPDDPQECVFQEFKSGLEKDTLITHVTAMWESSVIVMSDEKGWDGKRNRVYTCGTGHKGELGLGDMIFKSSKAQLIPDFPPAGDGVRFLMGGVHHVVVVLESGDAYGWGNGRKGQLGLPADIVYRPRKIEGVDFEVERAACGREFTFLYGRKGECIILGSNKFQVKSSLPNQSLPNQKQIHAGWGSMSCLAEDGTITCWGRNDHGQLAPADLPKLSRIEVGSEHAIGVTEENDVLAWGWGEHGNCGPGVDADGDVKGRWNTVVSGKLLPKKSEIVSIGAGCATSWIAIS